MECGIALGSNSGDRLATLGAAVAALRRQDPDMEVSPVYETAPVDCPEGSEPFLNAAAILHWSGSPESLLEFLQSVEVSLGRPPVRSRNAPRTIDLDILYAGELARTGDGLILPHPRMHLRRFVLMPLADLRPALILPGFTSTVQELLERLPADGLPPPELHSRVRTSP
jgi:2-amino-4-hydroxy-6-hydroxymethyldihydropteridine diphosphokinase